MDYEPDDGSQFSLREVWTEEDEVSVFVYTSVSAHVNGSAYVGKLPNMVDDVDADVLACLQVVPPECIYPKAQQGFTIAPDFDPAKHYLKAPSYTYDDCEPGKTFIADCVLNEVSVLERLKLHPHPNIATYFGCVVKNDRITHICMRRYPSSLVAQAKQELTQHQRQRIIEGVQAGLKHLHSLGLAHNDISPENIYLNSDGDAVIIDFDGCLSSGEKLLKGESMSVDRKGDQISNKDNDLVLGLRKIEGFLNGYAPVEDDRHDDEGMHERPDNS